MATRHYSSQMSEVGDVTDLLVGFEQHNKVRLEVRLGLTNREKNASILVNLLAHRPDTEIGDLPPLGSVSVTCSDLNLRRLMDVLTHALYALDFKLVLNEMPEVDQQR